MVDRGDPSGHPNRAVPPDAFAMASPSLEMPTGGHFLSPPEGGAPTFFFAFNEGPKGRGVADHSLWPKGDPSLDEAKAGARPPSQTAAKGTKVYFAVVIG